MKFNNKRLVIAMVGLFIFSLALVGCGGSGSGGGAAKPEEMLVIGSIQDMSGTTSVFGNAVTRGAEVAIEKLNASGSTNGEAAIKLAYQQARANFKKDGINRILMLTDGDFNVGVSGVDEMLDIIRRERDSGVSLSTFGFGEGNFKALFESIERDQVRRGTVGQPETETP